jgi:hypothetical protein
VPSLVEKIVELHRLFEAADLPHAFGGALALAWCTREPRGTSDVDVNVFVSHTEAQRVLDALDQVIAARPADRRALIDDGQVRLWWGPTPVDLFLNNTEFHDDVAMRTRIHEFAGVRVPFLSCEDLAVFKAFFNRPKDWVDIETMVEAGALKAGRVQDSLTALLGPDDDRARRFNELATTVRRRTTD